MACSHCTGPGTGTGQGTGQGMGPEMAKWVWNPLVPIPFPCPIPGLSVVCTVHNII